MTNILIVDDENLILAALSAAFRQDDTSVRAVSCGKDALAEIEQNFYNLCFLDINLPDMNGLDIMKTVKKVSPATKIVIMTGSEVDDEMLQSIQKNANLLIAKPFDLNRIKTFAENILAQGTPVSRAENHFYNDKEHEPFVNWLAGEKRRHERHAIMQRVSYVVVAADGGERERSFEASILDISEVGMGIWTGCLLKPGHLLRFTSSPLLGTGIVRWCRNAGTADSCRAGIQFVIPGPVPRGPGRQV